MQRMEYGFMRTRASGLAEFGVSKKSVKTLTASHLTLLILSLILLGLALLYFFPTSSAYVSTSPSGVWLLRDSQWAVVNGTIEKAEEKTGGISLRLCASAGGCVSIYAPQRIDGMADSPSLKAGQALRVWGEVSSAQGGARFVRAHKIELLANEELNQNY